MVLHHVAQRADVVIEIDAVANTEVFGDCNLHMINIAAAPQRLKQGIAEAQCQEILDGFLAEVVINSENLVFGETLADLVINRPRRFVIAADRLLEHNSHLSIDQAIRFQTRGDRAKQAGRRCEVDDPDTAAAVIEQRIEIAPTAMFERIGADIFEAIPEHLPLGSQELAIFQVRLQRFFDVRYVFRPAHLAATDRDYSAVLAELSVAVAMVQGRQQLAHRKIAGATKNYEIERVDRNQFRHGVSLRFRVILLQFCRF